MDAVEKNWDDLSHDTVQRGYEDCMLDDGKVVLILEFGAQLMVFADQWAFEDWMDAEGRTAFEYSQILTAFDKGAINASRRNERLETWLTGALGYRRNVGNDNKMSLRVRRCINGAQALLGHTTITVFPPPVTDDWTKEEAKKRQKNME